MKRSPLKVRAGRRYWGCNLLPWSPARKHTGWRPENPFSPGSPNEDWKHSLRKSSCSIGHQCLVNSSLISLRKEVGVGKENMVSFIECLPCTRHYTRGFPNSRHLRHYSGHFLYWLWGNTEDQRGQVPCPRSHRKSVIRERSEDSNQTLFPLTPRILKSSLCKKKSWSEGQRVVRVQKPHSIRRWLGPCLPSTQQ